MSVLELHPAPAGTLHPARPHRNALAGRLPDPGNPCPIAQHIDRRRMLPGTPGTRG